MGNSLPFKPVHPGNFSQVNSKMVGLFVYLKHLFIKHFFIHRELECLKWTYVLFLIIVYSTVPNQLKDASPYMEECNFTWSIYRDASGRFEMHPLSLPLGFSTPVKEDRILPPQVTESLPVFNCKQRSKNSASGLKRSYSCRSFGIHFLR